MHFEPFFDLHFFNGRLITWLVRASMKFFCFNSFVDSGTDIGIIADIRGLVKT